MSIINGMWNNHLIRTEECWAIKQDTVTVNMLIDILNRVIAEHEELKKELEEYKNEHGELV